MKRIESVAKACFGVSHHPSRVPNAEIVPASPITSRAVRPSQSRTSMVTGSDALGAAEIAVVQMSLSCLSSLSASSAGKKQ